MNISQFTNNSGYITSSASISGNAASATFARRIAGPERIGFNVGGDASTFYPIAISTGAGATESQYSEFVIERGGYEDPGYTGIAFSTFNARFTYKPSGWGYGAVYFNLEQLTQTATMLGDYLDQYQSSQAIIWLRGATRYNIYSVYGGIGLIFTNESGTSYTMAYGTYDPISTPREKATTAKYYDSTVRYAGTIYTGSNAVIHAGNIGSQSVASAGNASTVAGLAVHTGRNNEANKIVRTDVNAHLLTGWINTTSGAFSSAINKIYCSDDDYVRYQTPANFISNLGLITTSNIGSQSVTYATSAGSLSSMNISQFTNNSGYLTTETDTLATVVSRGNSTGGNRPITLDNGGGAIITRASAGGWAMGTYYQGSAGTTLAGFGAYGGNDSLTYAWIGPGYDSSWMTINSSSAIFAGSVGINNTSPVNSAWGNASTTKQLSIDAANYAVINLLGGSRRFSMGVGDNIFYMCYDNNAGRHNINVNSSGSVTIPVDVRSPIFYDSNDTAYYGDFASLSRVNEIGANKMRADTNGDYSTDKGWWSHDPYGQGWGKPHGSFRSLEVSTSGNFDTEPAMFRIHQWGSGSAEFWKPKGRTLYLRETPGGSGSWFDTFEVQGLTTTTSFGLTNGFRITSGSSDYASFSSWVYLPGAHGFYSAVNGAHFYPNNASYGSWRISGSRNGWHGIHFDSGATLMMNSNESGVHRENYGWQFRWENGTMYCHKNSYGGGVVATVLDSSNFGSWAAASSGNTGNEFGARSFFFPATTFNPSTAARDGLSSMSIKMWNNYFNGTGLGSDYGTVMEYYSLSGHVDSQVYFDAGGGSWYRTASYASGFGGWQQYITSANFTTWAQEKENQRLSTTSDVTHNSTTSPTFLVNNHSDNTKGYRIHNTSGTSVSAMFTNSSNQLVIAAGAVDQINLNKKVYVNGVALGVNIAPSATAGRIDASNDIVAYSSSDERLKDNITPIENALDKVKSLTGVEFDWKPEHKEAHGHEGHDTGIIAQQVLGVMPSAVRTNDTGYLAVRYEKLIGLLIEGMKEQQTQIDELKTKLDGLTK
jgi:hypothetical protein